MTDNSGQTWDDFKKGLDELRASGAPMPFDWCFASYNDAAIAAFNVKWESGLKLTCYACPVQLHGPLADGTWLYFRERHGEWEVNVGQTEDEAVYGTQLSVGEHDGVPGGMSIFQVLGVIDAALEARRE